MSGNKLPVIVVHVSVYIYIYIHYMITYPYTVPFGSILSESCCQADLLARLHLAKDSTQRQDR